MLKNLSAISSSGRRAWHKAFLRWIQTKGVAQTRPAFQKNASGPIGIPLKGVPHVPGDKPNPSEEG